MEKIERIVKKIPASSGVYIFKNKEGDIIYIGKATNLNRRVKSYFVGKDIKSRKIKEEVTDIDYEITETNIEALIREADLIKKYKPSYNIKENDDRSFLYVGITKDEYPIIEIIRGKDLKKEKNRSVFGPFVYSSEIRSALKIIRRIFPYSTHKKERINTGRPCFYYQINICPGTCVGEISKSEYLENIKNIELFFKGGKKKIITKLKKEMKEASKELKFEKAKELKRKIDALTYIQETALIGKKRNDSDNYIRIEGYDISNISGNFSVGSMVVFKGNIPYKKDYRLFKIRSVIGPNDTEMIKEVIERRFNNDWIIPHLIIVDGGVGQVNTVKNVLSEKGLNIPVIGIAKGKDRKKEELVGDKTEINKETLLKVQGEAHRFAINYHKKLRNNNFLNQNEN